MYCCSVLWAIALWVRTTIDWQSTHHLLMYKDIVWRYIVINHRPQLTGRPSLHRLPSSLLDMCPVLRFPLLLFFDCFMRIGRLAKLVILLCVIAECFACFSHRLGACLSVHHTHDLYQNGASYDHEIFTVGCPRSLVYHDKILCPWVWGFPLNESIKKGCPLKRRYFVVIGLYSVKTVADRYRHAAYHNKHWSQAF